MTFHHRSKISSVIDYSDYFTVNNVIGCCCKPTFGVPMAEQTSFNECQAASGFYTLPPESGDCASVSCPSAGVTGCCCSCTFLNQEFRALVESDILGSTYGMADGVGRCECEDIGGKWTQGPCDRSDPVLFCRQPNGVDVRLPKACCGATLQEYNQNGQIQYIPTAFCVDVCTPKECSEKTLTVLNLDKVINYSSTFFTNGRRCFFDKPNVGGPVAESDCILKETQTQGLSSVTTNVDYTFPVCNNSNFYCWGNGCEPYVKLINDGFYINPTVNDYNVLKKSGAASVLDDFNDLDNDKFVVGNGLFSPFTKNYLYMRSRYGKAALITNDNKVIFANSESIGLNSGVEYVPSKYNETPFYKYDRVEIGKNFVILRKQSNIGPAADFYGYLTPGITVSSSALNLSGVESVHALEEAICITRRNFVTNNTELLCQGYPFNTNQLTLIDGGQVISPSSTINYTIVPESVSCNGFHCTYLRNKLSEGRTLIEREWITRGEYKRAINSDGSINPIPPGRISTFILDPKRDFIDGMVVAGYNFDCFLEGVYTNPDTGEGTTNLSCVGVWDPSDTNQIFSTIKNYTFGVTAAFPGRGGQFADCDYNKCFAVSPLLDYCEDNAIGNCLIRQPECDCIQANRTTCDDLGGFLTNDVSCADFLESCEADGGYSGGTGGVTGAAACMSSLTVERGACCRQKNCGGGITEYECICRTRSLCNVLGGVFHKDKTVDQVDCGAENVSGSCCYRASRPPGVPLGLRCIDGWTNDECFTCIRIDESDNCVEYSLGGFGNESYGGFNNKWKNQEVCPNCAC